MGLDYPTFLMFGDSITEYGFNEYPARHEHDSQFTLGAGLTNAYSRKFQVLQRGYAGYTSREAVKLIEPILEIEHDNKPVTQQIRIAYVYFGTNDARLLGTNPENNQHIDLPAYIANMKTVIAQFTKRHIPVIAITPGIHDQDLWNNVHPEDLKTGDYRSNEVNKKYADALAALCNKLDVPVIHVYNLMTAYLSLHPDHTSRDLLADGIHFSGTGYRLVFDALMLQIKTHFPKVYAPNIALKFPLWRDLREDTVF